MFDLRDIGNFIAIAEAGSLEKAADKVGRTQPALTKCIQRLETELEVALFKREGRRLALTEAGRALAVRASALVSDAKDIRRQIQDIAQGTVGHIRIGCAATPAEHMLPCLAEEMLKQAPDVSFELTLGMNDVLTNALESRQVDLLFAPLTQTVLKDSRYLTQPFARDTVVVAASPDHPIFDKKIGMEDLVHYKWVLPGQKVATRQWLEQTLAESGLGMPRMQMETSSMSLLPKLIERTRLLSFISRRNLERGAPGEGLREVKLKKLEMHRVFGFIRLKDAYMTPATSLFLHIAGENAARELDIPNDSS